MIPTPIYHPYVAVGRDYFGTRFTASPSTASSSGGSFSTYEISGATTLIARMHPLMRNYRFVGFGGLVRRTVRLRGDEAGAWAFTALDATIDAAQ